MVRLPGLRQRRLEAALSQRDLAARAQLAATTIIRIEMGGEAHPSTLRKLADALGCEPRELLDPVK